MKTVTRFVFISLVCVFLSACGEEWSVIYTKDAMPYGNQRTAGSGPVYVRNLMMPPKYLNLETEIKTVEVSEPDPVEQSFKDIQSKSYFYYLGDFPGDTLDRIMVAAFKRSFVFFCLDLFYSEAPEKSLE